MQYIRRYRTKLHIVLLSRHVKVEVPKSREWQSEVIEELKRLISFCAIIQYYSTMSMVVSRPCRRLVAPSSMVTPRASRRGVMRMVKDAAQVCRRRRRKIQHGSAWLGGIEVGAQWLARRDLRVSQKLKKEAKWISLRRGHDVSR